MAMGTNFPNCVFGSGLSTDSSQNKVTPTKEYLRLKIADPMELVAFLGKDIKTLDIPKEAIKYIGSHPFLVYYDSTFLGAPCQNVILAFRNDYNTKTDYVIDFTIYCTEPNIRQCKEYLDKEIGECYSCGTEPYAAVNGGAVTYYTYYKDGICYHLSSGSANSYYTLRVSKQEPQGPPRRNLSIFQPVNGNAFIPTMTGFNTPSPKQQPKPDTREEWRCEACGHISRGKFCGECGKPHNK